MRDLVKKNPRDVWLEPPPPPFAILFTYMIFIYLQSFIYVNFSRVFNIANQWLTRHSPFAPLCYVDEWRAKSSPFWIQGGFSKFSRIMAANNTKRSVPLTNRDV